MNKLFMSLGFVLIPVLIIFVLFMTHSVETQITLIFIVLVLVITIIICFKAEIFECDKKNLVFFLIKLFVIFALFMIQPSFETQLKVVFVVIIIEVGLRVMFFL
ncbi:hypothetical protein QQ060_003046 [Listeria monocytogenes]|nr:hypothetical protein [Listeria monocytogenes]